MNKRWVILPVALLTVVFLQPLPLQAQRRETQLRTVLGTVVDRDDNPLPTSVVYLKNLRTQTVKTYIADHSGRYRFSGLDPNVDYEIQAKHQELVSSKHNISSYDSRKEIVIQLKVDKRVEHR